jgi:DNA-binding beta-propeller fold protein YncE
MPSCLSRRHCKLVKTLLLLFLACTVTAPVTAQVIDKPRTLYLIAGGSKNPRDPDGVGPSARFSLPTGIASSNDRLWVVDQSIHSLRRIDPDGRVETVIGLRKMCGQYNGLPSAARMCVPTGVVGDPKGGLYIADFMNATIRRFQDGSLDTVSKGGTACRRKDLSKDGQACFATALAVDNNKLYVTDALSVIYQIDILTGQTRIIAGQGRCASDDLTGEAAGFCSPQGIVVDPGTGTLYVADTENHTIRKITPEGVVSTFAGKAKTCGTADGKEGARFCAPHGIAIDPAGNLYVADTGKNTIRKITPDGLVSTVAGTAGIGRTVLGDLPGSIAMPLAIAVISKNRLAITTHDGEVLGINF